jgi:hypothetical protein
MEAARSQGMHKAVTVAGPNSRRLTDDGFYARYAAAG